MGALRGEYKVVLNDLGPTWLYQTPYQANFKLHGFHITRGFYDINRLINGITPLINAID